MCATGPEGGVVLLKYAANLRKEAVRAKGRSLNNSACADMWRGDRSARVEEDQEVISQYRRFGRALRTSITSPPLVLDVEEGYKQFGVAYKEQFLDEQNRATPDVEANTSRTSQSIRQVPLNLKVVASMTLSDVDL